MALLFLFNTSTQVHLHFSQVSKIDCLDRVTVRWVDGSESQFNVHPTGTWVIKKSEYQWFSNAQQYWCWNKYHDFKPEYSSYCNKNRLAQCFFILFLLFRSTRYGYCALLPLSLRPSTAPTMRKAIKWKCPLLNKQGPLQPNDVQILPVMLQNPWIP